MLFEVVFHIFILSVKGVVLFTRHPPSPKAMAGQAAVMRVAGGMSIPALLHGIAAGRTAGWMRAR